MADRPRRIELRVRNPSDPVLTHAIKQRTSTTGSLSITRLFDGLVIYLSTIFGCSCACPMASSVVFITQEKE